MRKLPPDTVGADSASPPKALERIKALLNATDRADQVERVASTHAIASLLFNAVKDSSVFVLGLGPEVLALTKVSASKKVIVEHQ